MRQKLYRVPHLGTGNVTFGPRRARVSNRGEARRLAYMNLAGCPAELASGEACRRLRLRFGGVVDNDQVSAASCQSSADRRRVSAATSRGDEFKPRLLSRDCVWEELPIPLRFDDHAELAMKLGSKVPRIARHDDAACRIMSEKPSDVGNRDTHRLERARRLIDQELPGFPGVDPHQLMGDRLHMPVVRIDFTGINGGKNLSEEDRRSLRSNA
jgi:hypothetical protein